MTFQNFQNRARLYVIGALYPQELAEFQAATIKFGERAKLFIRECQALHEAFALSVRPERRQQQLQHLMSMGQRSAAG